MRPEPQPAGPASSRTGAAGADAPPAGAADSARLFVALELPGAVTGTLEEWSARAVAGADGLRPVARDALHLTLCFLGTRPLSDVAGIGAVLRALADHPAILAVLAEPLWLPRRRPRVLAVRLQERSADRDGGGALAALQARLAGALSQLGVYEAEDRPYLPHVTVARVRRPFPRTAPDLPPAPEPVAFTVDRLTLFRSRLGAGPARYEALTSMVLGG